MVPFLTSPWGRGGEKLRCLVAKQGPLRGGWPEGERGQEPDPRQRVSTGRGYFTDEETKSQVTCPGSPAGEWQLLPAMMCSARPQYLASGSAISEMEPGNRVKLGEASR